MTAKQLQTNLHSIQRWLKWVITEPRGVAPALAEPFADEPLPRLITSVADLPPLKREERLAIYAEAYFSRIADALADDFAAVRAVLGKDAFLRLCSDYLRVHPSTSTNIGEVGVNLPAFVQNHPFIKESPFLAELAQLEWLLVEVFFADDVAPTDLAKTVTALSEEDLLAARFVPDTSVRLLRCHFPVDTIWKIRDDENFTVPKMTPGDVFLLIYRQQDKLYVKNLEATSWNLLNDLVRGLPLEKIFENAATSSSDESKLAAAFQSSFAEWTSCGVLQNVVVEK